MKHLGRMKLPAFSGLVCVVALVVLTLQLRQRVSTLEDLVHVTYLQHELRLPTEAIYVDFSALNSVSEIRHDTYTTYGTSTFLPYQNAIRPGSTTYKGGLEYPTNEPTFLHNGSFELIAHERARKVCDSLVNEIRLGKRAGGFLNRNPNQFDQLVRPWVVRLLDSYQPRLRISACAVLLEMGDRDPRLVQIVGITMTDPMAWERCVNLCDRHSLNVKRISQPALNGNDKKKKRIADWQRVHEIVRELKSENPITDSAA